MQRWFNANWTGPDWPLAVQAGTRRAAPLRRFRTVATRVEIYEVIYKLAVIVPRSEIKLSPKSKRLLAFIKCQANPWETGREEAGDASAADATSYHDDGYYTAASSLLSVLMLLMLLLRSMCGCNPIARQRDSIKFVEFVADKRKSCALSHVGLFLWRVAARSERAASKRVNFCTNRVHALFARGRLASAYRLKSPPPRFNRSMHWPTRASHRRDIFRFNFRSRPSSGPLYIYCDNRDLCRQKPMFRKLKIK